MTDSTDATFQRRCWAISRYLAVGLLAGWFGYFAGLRAERVAVERLYDIDAAKVRATHQELVRMTTLQAGPRPPGAYPTRCRVVDRYGRLIETVYEWAKQHEGITRRAAPQRTSAEKNVPST